jgi:hypothetical protein
MPSYSPYRALPQERRLALVAHALNSSREARALYIQRMVSRGGGFRAVTLRTWSVERLAREVVRTRAETADDELDLLQMLYVDLEPQIQKTFLDAAGVPHEEGRIADELQPPFAQGDSVRRAADAVRKRHGTEGIHYLRTLATYSAGSWPGIAAIAETLEG